MGGIFPHQLELRGFFSGFENLTTLSVILRHLEAELRCINLIRGVISTLKKI
jgi:hypothetical protein